MDAKQGVDAVGDEETLGVEEGSPLGPKLGVLVGEKLGPVDGHRLGAELGVLVGEKLGLSDGCIELVGATEGVVDGECDGWLLGKSEGASDGWSLGVIEGGSDGMVQT